MGTSTQDKPADSKKTPGYVQPPDGGWGWMVVLSSFLIHVIADGIVYSFGVFLPVFVTHFQSGRGETAWVGSLQPAVTFTVGPLASALTNRYGCRPVTIVGAVVAAVGFCISVFAENLYFLYLSSGVMAGLGFGLIYLPAIVSVAQYFEKRRSFATGLAVCGSGFGTFVMAPTTEQLLQTFGWRGAMLILGGVILNVVVCGAVFRPLEPSREKKDGDNAAESQALMTNGSAPREFNVLSEAGEPSPLGDSSSPDKEEGNLPVRAGGEPNPLPVKIGPRNQLEWLINSHVHLSPASNDVANMAKSDGELHQLTKAPDHARLHLARQLSGSAAAPRPVARKDVFYTASLQNIPMYRSQHQLYITSITSMNEGLNQTGDAGGKCCGVTVPSEFREALHQMMDVNLLSNPVFLIFAISNFFTSIGFNMPFIFLPDRAKLSGIDEVKAAWLLSTIGISNTIGRVVFGFMADLKWVNRLMLYNTALTICGVATALSPCVGASYELLSTYAAIFGIFIGVYVSLTSVVLVDLLGIDLLTNSFGLLLLFQGAATFIGPPLAGWMCDWTGSYDISFHVMGSLIAVSGAMLYFLPLVQRRYERSTPPQEIEHRIDMGVHSPSHRAAPDIELPLADTDRKTSV